MSLPLRQSPRKAKTASTGAAAAWNTLLSGGRKKQTISTTTVVAADTQPSNMKSGSRGRPPKSAAVAVTEMTTETENTTKTTKTAKMTTTRIKEEEVSPDKASKVSKTASAVKSAALKLATKASTASLKRKAKDEPEDEDDRHGLEVKAAIKTEEDVSMRTNVEDVKGATAAKTSKATKRAKTADDAPLAERTDVATLKKAMYIGAHISSAGGVQNAVPNSVHVGGNAFALFLKSQRKWQNPALADDTRDAFHAACAAHGYDAARHCLPHGSYLVNLAQPDPAKADQAYTNFVDDLRRCDALGIRLYNFHPGAAVAGSGTREAALGRIAAALNRAHADTAPSKVVTVIENMAGGGTTVGDRFEDLAAIIAQIDDKTRVGVCIDTCHAFAAGYDLRTPDAFDKVVADFDRIVGLQYLRAFHVNDSKAPLASRRDLHANIGTGFLGLRAFHSLVNNDAFAGLPMVLETPIDRVGANGKEFEDHQVWADEIKLLESLIGMDADTDGFRAKEEALQTEGAKERKRVQEQVDKKSVKDAKKKK
ncbi:AP endonuclease 1 [Sporothrix schenckii 1099-18]|uniref:Apurinic-apyrimidinic endonuclease 1 n=1 Tax=Sporothrix schenckii 1099-18 TaxID=1397361 RepID=A0A0F2M1C7_SPOSC|nr:AP endonuclease 1 [Sporothrix schenckii 1099-18]KJR82560.1 AP endonuclease 1 [Sporothrix schenckii 1099-18]